MKVGTSGITKKSSARKQPCNFSDIFGVKQKNGFHQLVDAKTKRKVIVKRTYL